MDELQNFVIFKTTTAKVNVNVFFYDETVWLTQKGIAELFETTSQNITLHFKNIFKDAELDEVSTCKEFLQVQKEGSRNVQRNRKYYNLKAITAVGYRVNSHRATEFRKWATDVLHEYIIKGFTMDDERLKQVHHFGIDYFDEQLDRIREIRISERRFYQKITDIYATSLDYNKDDKTTRDFFAKVQNKLHFAIHGNTAAQVIYNRANSSKENMGLNSWENAPKGKIIKTDVVIAKNYLSQDELESLGRIVNAYLDLAENRAKKNIPMTMDDWAKRLDLFLEFDDREILTDAGKITKKIADEYAVSEFEKYRIVQDRLFMSDFDKLILDMEDNDEQ